MAERRVREFVAACLIALAMVLTTSCTSDSSAPTKSLSSMTPSTIAVPDVVGLDVQTAETTLKKAGLSMDVSVMTGGYPNAAVIRQRPEPGAAVAAGANVHVVVGPAAAAG